MADVFSKEKRSEIMSRIRSKNTGIERAVFSYLRKRQIYFQKHYDKLPGKPDIAIPSKKIAVFINGDFWHGYRFSAWKNRIPKKYWRDKILSNIERDKRRYAMLRRRGWRVLKVWGHEIIKHPDDSFKKIEKFIKINQKPHN